jgi:hypothetical protein
LKKKLLESILYIYCMLRFNENRFFEKTKSRRQEKAKQLIKNFKKNYQGKREPLKRFSDFNESEDYNAWDKYIEDENIKKWNNFNGFPKINSLNLTHKAIKLIDKKFEELDYLLTKNEREEYETIKEIYDEEKDSKDLHDLNSIIHYMRELLERINERLI